MFLTLQIHYTLYDFNREISRVAESMGRTSREVTPFGKSPQTVKARAYLCYWAHRKLAMTATEIAGKLKITQPAASCFLKQSGRIEKEHGFHLIGE